MDRMTGITVMRIGAAVGMAATLAWGSGLMAGPSPFYSLIVYKGVFTAAAGLLVVGALVRRRERMLASRQLSPRRPLHAPSLPSSPRSR